MLRVMVALVGGRGLALDSCPEAGGFSRFTVGLRLVGKARVTILVSEPVVFIDIFYL
jgi:hypothetical protein